MQTWEWGAFQEAQGRKVGRYIVTDDNKPIAAFTLVQHALPFGLWYGYAPRGPVIVHDAQQEVDQVELLKTIKTWAKQEFPHLLFLRLEPPLTSLVSEVADHGFYLPTYYVQPRFNLAIPLHLSEDEIAGTFHPSTRSNLGRAQRRGVVVEIKQAVSDADYEQFSGMMRDTIKRNSGKNAYPSHNYFRSLFSTVAPIGEARDPRTLSLGIFYGYQNGEPAGAHFVLYFGDTATYLYGASYSDRLNSKVTTYLHWAGMREAKRLGFDYYDLGGIDESRWPSLTDFKRQFRGEEFGYIGNIDVPLRPALYHAYDLLRRRKK